VDSGEEIGLEGERTSSNDESGKLARPNVYLDSLIRPGIFRDKDVPFLSHLSQEDLMAWFRERPENLSRFYDLSQGRRSERPSCFCCFMKFFQLKILCMPWCQALSGRLTIKVISVAEQTTCFMRNHARMGTAHSFSDSELLYNSACGR
jgi:hypothetical protein